MSEWELKEKSTGELTVTIDGDEWKKDCDKAFNKLSGKISLPGFRKGKAPKAILEKQISHQEVEVEAVQDNANDWLRKALEEKDLNPISQPTLDIKSVDEEKAVVVFKFAVSPEVTLGDYKGLEYNLDDIAVSEEELTAELNRMRENYADLEVKADAADKGDTVNINYEGFKDGVPFDGGKADNYNLELGSNSFIPGFEDQLIGTKAGDEKDINVTFPEDYHEESLKGAPVVFKVVVNEVKTKVLPELTDDFAKDVNAPGVETAEDLKKLVKTRLESGKKDTAVGKADDAIIEKVAENAKVEIPDIMVEDEVNQLIGQLNQRIQQYGMNLKQYLSMMGQKAEDLQSSYKEQAAKNVKVRLVLQKIAEAEKLEPKAEDIEKEFKTIADQYKMEIDKVKSLIDPAMLKKDLSSQLAYDLIKNNAKKNENALKAEEMSRKEEQAAKAEAEEKPEEKVAADDSNSK
ncbi:MAG: trigger factor [Erysipelotrichia bacterium]|nr:trigger factor [Erysipelotrichia bacterium]